MSIGIQLRRGIFDSKTKMQPANRRKVPNDGLHFIRINIIIIQCDGLKVRNDDLQTNRVIRPINLQS